MKIRKQLTEAVKQVEAIENEYVDIAEQPIEECNAAPVAAEPVEEGCCKEACVVKECDGAECPTVDTAEQPVDESIDFDNPDDVKKLSDFAKQLIQGLLADAKSNKQVANAVDDVVDTKDNSVDDKVAAAAEQVADDTWKAEDLIPGSEAAVGLNNGTGALNAALITAVRNKESGVDRDYPNIILSGLAGFGKTAMVKSFCKEHHLNLFECDAKSLDVATVGGIPYPKQDKDGALKQMPITSSYWDKLSLPNTVLFLDEFNRAQDNVAGTLLGLINNHDLPMTTKGKDGKYSTMKHFDNILFTVIAINPASNVFANVAEFTPEKVSRGVFLYNIKPDRNELLTCLRKLYGQILANPYLDDKIHRVYEGQLNIAEALLTNSAFTFDDVNDVEKIHNDNNSTGDLTQFLNYRSLTGALSACNGTKLNFLAQLFYYRFSPAKQTMIKSILQSYADKTTKGNTVFSKAQQQAASIATAAQKNAAAVGTRKIVGDFMASLDDEE